MGGGRVGIQHCTAWAARAGREGIGTNFAAVEVEDPFDMTARVKRLSHIGRSIVLVLVLFLASVEQPPTIQRTGSSGLGKENIKIIMEKNK